MPGSESAGMPEKKASKAASPPAEAPMPTTGKSADGRGADGSDWSVSGGCVEGASGKQGEASSLRLRF